MMIFSEGLSLPIKAPLIHHVVKQVILEAVSHTSRTPPSDSWLKPRNRLLLPHIGHIPFPKPALVPSLIKSLSKVLSEGCLVLLPRIAALSQPP